MPTLEYEIPGDIDGEPEEVAAAAEAQLRELAAIMSELTDRTAVQRRNAWLTTHLDANPQASPDELAELWPRSDAHAWVSRQRTLAAALLRACQPD